MHMRTLTVLEPGRKRKRDNPQEWARQMRAYNCPPGPHSPVNVPDQMPYKNVHKISATTLIKVPRRPNRSDPRIQSPCASPCICTSLPTRNDILQRYFGTMKEPMFMHGRHLNPTMSRRPTNGAESFPCALDSPPPPFFCLPNRRGKGLPTFSKGCLPIGQKVAYL